MPTTLQSLDTEGRLLQSFNRPVLDPTNLVVPKPAIDPLIADVPYAQANPTQQPPQTNITYLPAEPEPEEISTEPEIVPGTPTLAEIREYNRLNDIVNPVLDLSAEEIANLATDDPDHFNLEQSLIALQPHWDSELVNKAADAYNLLERRGWKPPKDLGMSKLPGMAADVAKGTAKTFWSLAKGALGVPFAMAAEKIDELSGLPPSPGALKVRQGLQREIAENIAGTESSITGLSFMGEKAYNKLFGKKPELKTQQEKIDSLKAALIPHLAQKKIAEGQGPVTKFTQAQGQITQELEEAGLPLRPEEVELRAAGDPLGFFLFGKGLEGVATVAGLAKPVISKAAALPGVRAIAPAVSAVAEKIPTVEGAAGKAIELTGAGIRKTAPITGTAATLGTLGAAGPALLPVSLGQLAVAGLIGEAAGISRVSRFVRGGINRVRQAGTALETAGKQIAGTEAVTGATTQAVRDLFQSIPTAAGHVGHGAALDLGLAALTSTTPEDTQALQLGTILGAAQAARKTAGWVVSGQRIAPRPWGTAEPVASSRQLPVLDAMHDAAYAAATPAVRQRVNSVRQFLQGVDANTDVFLADPKLVDARGVNTGIERALLDSGFTPEEARLFARQNGFFSAAVPDPARPEQTRRAIVLANADAAPHEALHAFQDVIGEQTNQALDQIIKKTYSTQWESIARGYTEQLLGRKLGPGESWRDRILETTGFGDSAAQVKADLQAANQISLATGAQAPVGDVSAISPRLNRGSWKDALTDAEKIATSDKYIAREIAAENFDAAFRSLGQALQEKSGILPTIARVVAATTEFLGGDSLAGRTSQELNVPLAADVIQEMRGQVNERRANLPVPEVTPRQQTPPPTRPSPLPSGSPAPITPADREAAAEETRTIAQEASDTPVAGGTRSERELLGEIAVAQATGDAVKLNYLSAPDEPAAAISSNRTVRRQIIEMFRTMPQAARALWEKNFFPERVRRTGKGKIQVGGWAPEVFAANAHKTADVLNRLDPALSPYELDATTRSFSEAGWRELYEDVKTFVQNQMAGRTGSGEPLVVPRSMEQAGFFKPPEQAGAGALDQRKADFISAMFGMKLPETPRVQKGKTPLNIAGQVVSEATLPGRTETPTRPRAPYGEPFAGREIREVNPWRAEFERAAQQAGAELPSTIEAFQWLNLENIKEVSHSPEQPQFRGNTLTLQAGFQPKEIELTGPDGKKYKARFDGYWDLTSMGRGHVAALTALEDLPGVLTKLSSGMGPTLEKAGYKLPADLPAPEIQAQPRGRPEDEGLDKTFNDFIAGARAAILENQRDLAEGFLKRAVDAADFQRTLSRKGDVSEFGDKSIDAKFDEQMGEINSIKDELKTIQDESKIFLEKGLAGRVFEAGGKLKKHPPFESMEGTGFKSHAELIDAAIEGDISVIADYPGFWRLSRVYGSGPGPDSHRALWKLAAKISDEGGARLSELKEAGRLMSRSHIMEKPGAVETPEGIQTDEGFYSNEGLSYGENLSYETLRDHIWEIQHLKNSLRIKNGFFGKRLPFSQLRKPKETQFQPKPAQNTETSFHPRDDEYAQTPVQFKPAKVNPEAEKIADDYVKTLGLPKIKHTNDRPLPIELLKQAADELEDTPHAPRDPKVIRGYQRMLEETVKQGHAIIDAGIDVEKWPGQGEPYKNSQDMIADVVNNKHLYFLPVETGFGKEGGASCRAN